MQACTVHIGLRDRGFSIGGRGKGPRFRQTEGMGKNLVIGAGRLDGRKRAGLVGCAPSVYGNTEQVAELARVLKPRNTIAREPSTDDPRRRTKRLLSRLLAQPYAIQCVLQLATAAKSPELSCHGRA